MKIVVISDIHSNYDALRKVSSRISNCDFLICLGDLVGYGAQPNEVIEEIRSIEPQIVIAGNHDYAVVTGDTSNFIKQAALAINWTRQKLKSKNLSYLSKLLSYSKTTIENTVIASYHGSPRDPLNEYIYPGASKFIYQSLIECTSAKILLLGHTHIPFYLNTKSGILINPGSIGQPRDGDPRLSYAVIQISNDQIDCRMERRIYEVEYAASRIIKAGLPEFLAKRLFLGM